MAVAIAVLAVFRARVDRTHVVLVLLLVILGASAAGGRLLGVLLSITAFFAFDWAFLPPFNTLAVRDPLDWIALVAFLVTSLVAAQLLYTARARRDAVERAQALREADLLKDALIATVSHDLRTPLTSIIGLAHELAHGGDEQALMIEEEAQRLNRLVTDLLDVARLSAGEFPLDIQPNALDDLLGVVVRQFAGRSDRHRLRASLDHPDEVVIGRFDMAQTVRIVTNLVENALKYSPVDASVQLTGGRDGGSVVIRVEDSGPGLPPEETERAFEPFTRMTSAPPDTGSAGLGLSIARGLANAEGGAIQYRRRAGGGSVFTLSLPADQP
jgi:two-component system sensor histidine kinase KdpD